MVFSCKTAGGGEAGDAMLIVTGAFGLLGTELMALLSGSGEQVLIIERPGARVPPSLRGRVRKLSPRRGYEYHSTHRCRKQWMWIPLDISIPGWSKHIPAACKPDGIFHLAALIPPQADRNPGLSERVNLKGSRELISWARLNAPAAPFMFTSSIAVYGDRRNSGEIFPQDPLRPSPGDYYARHKIAVEQCLKESGLPWNILRMSYIVSPAKLEADPLMFHMPLDTRIETVHAKDAAMAVHQAFQYFRPGEVLNIGGGEKCRTVYREYLLQMFSIFGLNPGEIPTELFSTKPFHCGWMNTDESCSYLDYQHRSLLDFYLEVYRKKQRIRRSVHRFRRRIWMKILKGSDYFTGLSGGIKSRMIMSLMNERMSSR